MLLCGTLVFLAERERLKLLPIVILILLGGFLIEWVGVETGLLFGNYFYGSVLGLKVVGVPLIIAVNWFVIVVSASSLVIGFKQVPLWLKALLAGLSATLMDALIEPVAIRYKFWIWDQDEVPFFNYCCWFLFSSLFAFLYLRATSERNRTGFFLFFIWLVFFITLNLI